MNVRRFLPFCLLVIAVPKAPAWGPEGHEIVGSIALRYLTPAAKTRVAAVLNTTPDQVSLAAVANWADKIRPVRPETAPWHFVDIPRKRTTYIPGMDCSDGDCVIAQITQDVEALKNGSGDQMDALRFLVHFVGDIHQPLHCADNNDRGGNQVHIKFHDEALNLHKLWDSGLLDQLEEQDQLTADLIKKITKTQLAQGSSGTPTEWALESHALADKTAYGLVPKRQGRALAIIDEDYENAADPIVEVQLQKAGVRLAMLLNQIYGSN